MKFTELPKQAIIRWSNCFYVRGSMRWNLQASPKTVESDSSECLHLHYLSHHALGTLADQLVRKGMLVAAKAGEEDHRKDGEADPQQQPVEAKPE